MRTAIIVLALMTAVGVWWLVQDGEAQPTPVASSPTALSTDRVPETPQTLDKEPEIRKVLDISFSNTPTPLKWDDRCAILALKESYGTNLEDKAMCGEINLISSGPMMDVDALAVCTNKDADYWRTHDWPTTMTPELRECIKVEMGRIR